MRPSTRLAGKERRGVLRATADRSVTAPLSSRPQDVNCAGVVQTGSLLVLEPLVAEVQGAGVLGDGADDRFVEAVGRFGRDLDGDLDGGRGVG
jgi:hypothetical protein